MSNSYADFESFNESLKELFPKVHPCTKLGGIANIVLPVWDHLGAFALMHKFVPRTAEDPEGTDAYAPDKYRSVLRIVNGKILFDDPNREAGIRTDNYCWTTQTVDQLIAEGKTKPIGSSSEAGLMNFAEVWQTVKSEEDRRQLSSLFATFKMDMLLAYPDASDRLFLWGDEMDMPWVINEWETPNEEGLAPVTRVEPEDAVIFTQHPDGSVTCYRVERKMFDDTYRF